MRNYFKYLFILVPLTVLLSLPCATKRQIKQSINAVENGVAANKGESLKYCTSIVVEKDQTSPTIKRAETDTPPVYYTELLSHSLVRVISLLGTEGSSDQKPAIPLFLLYRQLIIYF